MFRNTFDRFKHLTVEQIQLMTTHPDPVIPPHIDCKPFTLPLKCREIADNVVSAQFSTLDREKLDWNLKMSCEKLPDLKGEWLQHKDASADGSTLLFFHGGAYFFGSYKTYRPFLYKIVEVSYITIKKYFDKICCSFFLKKHSNQRSKHVR
jgi:acetyl esterase/lipase